MEVSVIIEKAERILFESRFQYIKTKDGHKIYQKDKERFVLPFYKGKILHSK